MCKSLYGKSCFAERFKRKFLRMTKAQRIQHKIGNALRKARLLRLYHKVKPSKKGWIPLGALPQNGKYTIETGIEIYDGIKVP